MFSDYGSELILDAVKKTVKGAEISEGTRCSYCNMPTWSYTHDKLYILDKGGVTTMGRAKAKREEVYTPLVEFTKDWRK